MDVLDDRRAFEVLSHQLQSPSALKEFKARYDHYRPHLIPRMLGKTIVWGGNIVYGFGPSYLKFRAVEVIARVPYHSLASACYTLLTRFYSNERRSLELSKITKYARLSMDNETMHVVVISKLAREETPAGVMRYTIAPMIFAFFYFWIAYLLCLISPRYAGDLNFVFESHAFEQYNLFLHLHGETLKQKPVHSVFLEWYGRHPQNQYEFFCSLRSDEIIHRNNSVGVLQKKPREIE